MQTLRTIKFGEDLGYVQLTTADGTRQPLVPPSISSNDKPAAARFISQALKVSATLPSDGSTNPRPHPRATTSRKPGAHPLIKVA
jgi:hypothetical protein